MDFRQDVAVLCFNSKMVRFKEVKFTYNYNLTKLFQFQNGTVKSLSLEQVAFDAMKFQFQNGSSQNF